MAIHITTGYVTASAYNIAVVLWNEKQDDEKTPLQHNKYNIIYHE